MNINNKRPYELGIVLCHEVNSKGQLSSETKARINKGISLYNQNKVDRLIFSGGKIEGHSFSVAEKMGEYAFPKIGENYDLEEISLDTVGQLIFVKEGILEPKNIKDIYIITNHWHLPKTELMTRYLFNKEYNIRFISVENGKYPEKRKEDFKKIPQFLKTFEKWEKQKGTLVDYLLDCHPWYKGSYPFRKLNKEYFSGRFKELKEKNE
jgi:uncharacterized SAM-binding protein YcdF (DUF218 family)